MLTRPDRDDAPDREQPLQAPHNIDAEQALLGAIFINNQVFDRLPLELSSDDFYDPLHGRIFDLAAKMIQGGRAATPVSLKQYFEHDEPIVPVRVATDGTVLDSGLTVVQYLGRLAVAAASLFSAPEYARTVRDLAVRRKLMQLAADMMDAAVTADIDTPPAQLIEDAETALFALSSRGAGSSRVDLGAACDEAIRHAEMAYQSGTGMVGIPTGIADLDDMLGGIGPTDLIIIGGRPSMGKTALATNIAYHCSTRDCPVDFYSMEMSAAQLGNRLLGEHAGISSHHIRRGRLEDDHFRRLIEEAQRLGRLPFSIEQHGGLTVAQLASKARRHKRQRRTGLIVVDYLQLMRSSKRDSNRVGEITEITVGLKALAKELETPIIALSQLSRQVEQRENKRPQMSDLRESGSIEQDADVVMFTYREEYYLERTRPDPGDMNATNAHNAKLAAARGKAEIILGKQRHGPTGIVEVQFDSQFTRFSNLLREAHNLRAGARS